MTIFTNTDCRSVLSDITLMAETSGVVLLHNGGPAHKNVQEVSSYVFNNFFHTVDDFLSLKFKVKIEKNDTDLERNLFSLRPRIDCNNFFSPLKSHIPSGHPYRLIHPEYRRIMSNTVKYGSSVHKYNTYVFASSQYNRTTGLVLHEDEIKYGRVEYMGEIPIAFHNLHVPTAYRTLYYFLLQQNKHMMDPLPGGITVVNSDKIDVALEDIKLRSKLMEKIIDMDQI